MNKKAEGEGMSIIFSIIFLTLILSIFWVFSFVDRGTIREETSTQIDISNINIDLLNLLRTKVGDTTISDLIVESYANNDYTKLTTEVNYLFLNNFDKDYCWSLFISDLHEIHNTCSKKKISSEIKIPTLDSKDLTIKLTRSK